MPEFTQVSHTSFSVRDREASARWHEEVLGFVRFDRSEGAGWHGIMAIHPPTKTIIEFQEHEANQGETFDPRRTGLDHIGFKVDTRAELDDWLAHFDKLGVQHSPIAERDYGSVLCFRDPDDIQFEMFYRANHP